MRCTAVQGAGAGAVCYKEILETVDIIPEYNAATAKSGSQSCAKHLRPEIEDAAAT